MITLEKIDQVVERTGVSYEMARAALEETEGDVVEAIIHLEQSKTGFANKISEGINEKTNKIIDTLKETIRKGNVSRILLKNENETLLNLPLIVGAPLGVMGAIWQPVFTMISMGLATYKKFDIVLVNENGVEYNLNDIMGEKIQGVKSHVSKTKANISDKINNTDDKEEVKEIKVEIKEKSEDKNEEEEKKEE